MKMCSRWFLSAEALVALASLASGGAFAQPTFPPLPPPPKLVRPPPGYAARLVTNRPPQAVTVPQLITPGLLNQPGQAGATVRPAGPPYTAVAPAVNQLQLDPNKFLTWNSESQEYSAKVGDTNAHFAFILTNISPQEVLINSVRTSCGCTVAQLPEQPWHVGPGASGPINVTVDLRNKFGTIVKSVTVDSSVGIKTLMVRINVPTQAAGVAGSGDMDRLRNMQMTMADRQVVFRNECARCHADPARDAVTGKEVLGKDLYVSVCGVCHDSPHRATMVPDLKALKHPTNGDHWRTWTASGKVGTMMPAFSKAQGGPLSDTQITSLVQYLVQTIPSNSAPAAAANAAPIGLGAPIARPQ